MSQQNPVLSTRPRAASGVAAVLSISLALLLGLTGCSEEIQRPTAVVDGPTEASVGELVRLDGSASRASQGGPLRYQWSFAVVPPGSEATYNDPTTVQPSFVPDVPGTYTIGLVVQEGELFSLPFTHTIEVSQCGSQRPVVSAIVTEPPEPGVGRPVGLRPTVTDADNEPPCSLGQDLSYAWDLVTRPTGSRAELDDPSLLAPALTPDVAGEYTVTLVVTDAVGLRSEAFDFTFEASLCGGNTPVVDEVIADPSPAVTGELIALSALVTDVDNSPTCALDQRLEYSWTLSERPTGSRARVDSADLAASSFVPDVAGSYTVTLEVTDETGLTSAPGELVVLVADCGTSRPIIDAVTADPAAPNTFDTVTLGAEITDPDTTEVCGDADIYLYDWAIQDAPAGSGAELGRTDIAGPTFRPDVPGDYIIRLRVTDVRGVNSQPFLFTLTASECGAAPPTATLESNVETPIVGDRVVVSAAVTDADADDGTPGDTCRLEQTFTYEWSIVAMPIESASELLSTSEPNTSFVPDVAGSYRLQLVVTDSEGHPGRVTIDIEVVDDGAPAVVATADPSAGLTPLSVAFSCRSDAGEPPFIYAWDFGNGFTSAEQNPTFLFTAAGSYLARCEVTDRNGDVGDDTVSIDVEQDTAPQVAISASVTRGLTPLEVAFGSEVRGGNFPLTYVWDFGDGSDEVEVVVADASGLPVTIEHIYEGAGTHLASLTVTDGQGDSAVDHLQIVAENRVPRVVARATPDGGIEPLEVQLEALVSSGDPPFAYEWDFKDGSPLGRVAAPSHTFEAAGVYEVEVTVEDVNEDVVSDTVTVTVDSDDGPVDNGVAIVVTQVSTLTPSRVSFDCVPGTGDSFSGNPPFSFLWEFDDGTSSTLQSPVHTYEVGGRYHVSCTVFDSNADFDSATVVVDVVQDTSPSVTVTADPVAGLTPLVVTFSAEVVGGNFPLEATWNFGDASVPIVETVGGPGDLPLGIEHEYGADGTYMVQLTVEDAQGDRGIDFIQVGATNSEPVVVAQAEPEEGIAPLMVQFTASVAGGDEPLTFEWQFGDSTTSTLQNPTHIYANQGEYTATVRVEDANQGTDTASVTVVVAADDKPSDTGVEVVYVQRSSLTPSTVEFECVPAGDAADFSGNPPFTFFWEFDDGTTSGLQNPTHTYEAGGTYNASCRVTDANGDFGIGAADVTVVQDTAPAPTLTASTTTGLTPLQVTFTGDVVGGNVPMDLRWDFSDDTAPVFDTVTSRDDLPLSELHEFEEPGTYLVAFEVTDAQGDRGVDYIQITAIDTQPTVFASAEPDAGLTPLEVQFQASVTGGDAPLTYSWDFGDGEGSSSEQNPVYVYDTEGDHVARVTVQDGNGDSAEATVTVSVELDTSPTTSQVAVRFERASDLTPSVVDFFCEPVSGDAFTGNPPLSFFWQFDDGTVSTVQNPRHVFSIGGTYHVSCTVTDVDGDFDTGSVDVPVVADTAPEATLVAEPVAGLTPLEVGFTGIVLGGNRPLEVVLDYGDGSAPDVTVVDPGAVGLLPVERTHPYNEPGNYLATLTATDAQGDRDVAFAEIAVTNSSPIVVAGADPTAGIAPLTVDFTASVAGGDPPLEYRWSFGDSGTSALQNPSHTFNTGDTYTVHVEVEDANGETATDTIQVVVEADTFPATNGVAVEYTQVLPFVPSSVSFSCVPGDVAGFSGNPPLSFAWDFGDGTSASVQNPTHLYTVAGTYEVSCTVTDANGDSAVATADPDVTVVEDSVPVASLTAVPSSGLTTLVVNFEGAVAGGNLPLSLVLDFGDGTLVEAEITSRADLPLEAQHEYGAPGTYLATFEVRDAQGDDDVVFTEIVASNSTPSVVASADTVAGIAPLTVNFTSAVTGGDEPLVYAWDFGDGGVSGVENPTYTFETEGLYEVEILVDDANGDQARDTLSIAVEAESSPAEVGVAVVVDPISLLTPATINFACIPGGGATEFSGNPPLSFLWDFGDGTQATIQNPTHVYTAGDTTYHVTCTVTDANNDSAVGAADVTVATDTSPEATLTAIPTTGLTSLVVSFEAAASGGNLPLTLSLDYGDGSLPDVVEINQRSDLPFTSSHPYDEAGSFLATLTVSDAQGDTDIVFAQIVPTNSVPSVVAGASATAGIGSLTVDFTAAVTGGDAPITYQWAFGDGGNSGAENPRHTFGPGDYTVEVTVEDANGDPASDTIFVSVAADTSPDETGVEVTVFQPSNAAPSQVDFNCVPAGGAADFSGNPPFAFFWTFDDGTTSAQQAPTHIYGAPGTYDATCTVTDTDGDSANATAQVTVVLDTDPAPLLSASTTSGLKPLPVTFTVEVDGGNYPIDLTLDFGDGTIPWTGTATVPGNLPLTPGHDYANAGTYAAQLTAVDDQGDTGVDAVVIEVTNSLPTVTAEAVPESGIEDLLVSFEAFVSGGDAPFTYTWEFGDGTNGSGRTTSHSYTEPDTYTVSVTVGDVNGDSDTATLMVEVLADIPLGTASILVDQPSTEVPSTVAFRCPLTGGAGNPPLAYAWTFGDGGSSSAAEPVHTYETVDTFTVTCTITDANLDLATASTTVTVDPVDIPANVTASASATVVQPGQTVLFQAEVSGNEPIDITWDFGDGASSSLQNPSHAYAGANQYDASVSILDADGDTAQDLVEIVVTEPPTAEAGGDQCVAPGTLVVLSGAGSTDDDPLEYHWTLVPPVGSASTLSDPNVVNPTFTPDIHGFYQLELEVTDGWFSDSDTMTVESLEPTNIAFAGPTSGEAGQPFPDPFEVSLTGACTLTTQVLPIPNWPVDWSDPINLIPDAGTTMTDGAGATSNTAVAGGNVNVDAEWTATARGTTVSHTFVVDVTPGPPAEVTFAAPADPTPVLLEAEVTATVTDQFGNPADDPVTFELCITANDNAWLIDAKTNGCANLVTDATGTGSVFVRSNDAVDDVSLEATAVSDAGIPPAPVAITVAYEPIQVAVLTEVIDADAGNNGYADNNPNPNLYCVPARVEVQLLDQETVPNIIGVAHPVDFSVVYDPTDDTAQFVDVEDIGTLTIVQALPDQPQATVVTDTGVAALYVRDSQSDQIGVGVRPAYLTNGSFTVTQCSIDSVVVDGACLKFISPRGNEQGDYCADDVDNDCDGSDPIGRDTSPGGGADCFGETQCATAEVCGGEAIGVYEVFDENGTTPEDPIDLDFLELEFVPVGPDDYDVTATPITELPFQHGVSGAVFSAELTALPGAPDMGDNDCFLRSQIVPGDPGFTPLSVPFFGGAWDEVGIGSNGYLSLLSPGATCETIESPTANELFGVGPGAPARIAGLLTNLDPTLGGEVWYAVYNITEGTETYQYEIFTWLDIPEFGADCTGGCPTNTVQIAVNATGEIFLSYLGVTVPESVAGLAAPNPDGLAAPDQVDLVLTGTDGTADIVQDSFTAGETLDLQVTDADLNTDSGAVETVDVEVDCDNTNDLETVTLTETGVDTGEFHGTVDTAFGAAAADNLLNCDASSGDETATMTYTDALAGNGEIDVLVTDTASMNTGTDGTADISVATFTAGDTLNLTVTDVDLNTDPGSAQTVDVSVACSQTGDVETVTLNESGNDTGIFQGDITTAFGAAATDGDLNCDATAGAETATLTYTDALRASGETDLAIIDTAAMNTGVTATVAIAQPSFTAEDTLDLQVADADLDTNPASAETVDVTVDCFRTADSETVTLTETGINTGIFEGSITTAFGSTVSADDLLNCDASAGAETATLSYTDALQATGEPNVVLTDTSTMNTGATADLSLTPAAFTAGEPLTVSVTDADLNLDSGTAEEIQVPVKCFQTGDEESVTLTETGADTGVFTGTVATTFGSTVSADDLLNCDATAGDEEATVSYTDALQATGEPNVVLTDTSTMNKGVTADVSLTPASFRDGDSLTPSVTDADLNTDAGTAETVSVQLACSNTGDTENVTLTETDVDTGVFTETVPTDVGAGTPDNGILGCSGEDTATLTYTDTLQATGEPDVSVTATSTMEVGTNGTVNITETTFQAEDPLTLAVTDDDLNTNTGAADSVNVVMTCTNTGDTETVPLTETGDDTGTFTGSITTAFGAAAEDGELNCDATSGPETATLTYIDEFRANGDTSGITVTDTATLETGTDGTASIEQATFTAGTTLDLEVVDTDSVANATGNTGDTLSVTVTSTDTGDSVTLPLTDETTDGTFVGTLVTEEAATANDTDNTLQVSGVDDVATLSYDDQFRANGDTTGVAVTDTATVVAAVAPASTSVEKGTDGTADIVEADFVAGVDLTVQVADADASANATVGPANDMIVVTVDCANTGDTETLTLPEDAGIEGLFADTIATAFDDSGTDNSEDGTLQCDGTTGAEVASVIYTDALRANGDTGVDVKDTADMVTGEDATVTVSPDPFSIGDVISVQVVDNDTFGNATPGTANDMLLEVTVTCETSLDSETLLDILESDTAEGVFETTIGTSSDSPVSGDGALQCAGAGDAATATYTDPLRANGDAGGTAVEGSATGQ